MYLRARKAKGQIHYQLVHRYVGEDGKLRQETIALGTSPTLAPALVLAHASLRNATRERAQWVGVQTDLGSRLLARFTKAVVDAERRIATLTEAQRRGIGATRDV